LYNKKCSTKRNENKPFRQPKNIPPSEENAQTVAAKLIGSAYSLSEGWNKIFYLLFLTR